jgi:hypothetical protein
MAIGTQTSGRIMSRSLNEMENLNFMISSESRKEHTRAWFFFQKIAASGAHSSENGRWV